MPTNFEPHYLGSKKLLTVIMDPAKAYSAQSYLGGSGTSKAPCQVGRKPELISGSCALTTLSTFSHSLPWATIVTRIESFMWTSKPNLYRWRGKRLGP